MPHSDSRRIALEATQRRIHCPTSFHRAILVVSNTKTMARDHHNQSKEPPKKRGEYRAFDEISGVIRKAAIQSIATKVIEQLDQRGGKQCAPGFVKGLIVRVTETTPSLVITRDDVNNEVRRRTKARQKQQQQADLPQTISQPSPTSSQSALTMEPFTAAEEAGTILSPASANNDSDDDNHMSVESHSTADEDVDLPLPSPPPPPSQLASTAEPFTATDCRRRRQTAAVH